MILDVQTVTIHHPQKTNGHLHPSAPPITVMTSAEGRQAKKEWWPTAVDLLDICVCVCTCGVRQVFNLLLYSAVTQWFHNLRDSSPQNLKMSAFSSVWWNWAVQVGVFKTSKKNSTVSLSGNHNLVPRDNPQALNYFPYRCTDGSVHLLIKPPARLQIQLSKWNDFYLINAVR